MIEDLVNGFDAEVFCAFLNDKFSGAFSKVVRSIPVDKDLPWKRAEQLGVVKTLPGSSEQNMPLLVVAVELPAGEELRERSSRIKQFRFAKKVLDEAMSRPSPGVEGVISQGLFVFYDGHGNFRLSLVYGKAEGPKLAWSAIKRLSFYVEAGAGNKTFRDRAALSWSPFDKLKDAFSVEKLTKEFYNRLFAWYQWALSDEMNVTYPNDPDRDDDDRDINEHIIRLLTRLMFVWFLKQKHLIPNDIFDTDKLSKILKDFKPTTGDNYYRAILQNLFFATLNSEIPEREFAVDAGNIKENKEHFDIKMLYRYGGEFAISEKEVLKLFSTIPFLNGGLFECLDRGKNYYDGFSRNKRQQARVPNKLFFDETNGLIPLLSQYHFTVEENSPGDEEVALDPELLGKVFENLLGAYNPETNVAARKATGSFYTPREIVNYMVDESLIAHLAGRCGDEHADTIRKLFTDAERPSSKKLCEQMDQALVTAKILDPACGSGAFPMGVLLRMVDLLRILRNIQEDASVYDLKLELIENCIYGSDIQCIAVQISKLRFFISLVCEQKPTRIAKDNYGIHTLPNLETKFVAADSLIGLPTEGKDALDLCTGNIVQLKDELWKIRHQHFMAKSYQEKKELRKQDRQHRDEIKKAVKQASKPNKERLAFLEKERTKVAAPKWERMDAPRAQHVELFTGATTAEPAPRELAYDTNEKSRKDLDNAIARESKKASISSTVIDSIADKLASWDPYDQNTSATFSDPEWMFNVRDGFDIVIGNPPYLGGRDWKKEDKSLYDYYLSTYEVAEYQFDMYVLFLERGVRLSAQDGVIAYITPNTWLNNKSTACLRRYVLKHTTILAIVDYTRETVFEAAVVLPIVTILQRTPAHDHRVAIFVPDEGTLREANSIRQSSWAADPDCIFNLDATEEDVILRAKLEEDSEPVSQFATVKFGVKLYETGKGTPPQKACAARDHVFEASTQKGVAYREYLEGKDVDRFLISWQDRWLKYGKNLAAPRDPDLFTGERLLFRRIVGKNLIGAFTDAPYVTSQLLQIVKPHDGINASALLGILNSKLIGYYFRKRYNRQDKTFPEIRIYELGALPIKSRAFTHDGNPFDTEPLASLVQKAIEAKKHAPDADTSELEAEIDRIVYQLYGLTAEEIAIVESALTNAKKTTEKTKMKKEAKETAMKKTTRRKKSALPPSLPGWD